MTSKNATPEELERLRAQAVAAGWHLRPGSGPGVWVAERDETRFFGSSLDDLLRELSWVLR